MKSMKQSTRLELLWAFVIILMVVVITTCAHCKTQRPKQRSQKQVVASINPVTYLFGTIESGTVYRYHGQIISNLQVQPEDANSKYDMNITFCGDVSEMIEGKGALVVFSFDRVMHEGMCYDLISIHGVD